MTCYLDIENLSYTKNKSNPSLRRQINVKVEPSTIRVVLKLVLRTKWLDFKTKDSQGENLQF